MIFEDRKQAGEILGDHFAEIDYANPIIFGIPRGGVIPAAEVAKKMAAPLDIVVTRKLGMPFNPEFGFGAIAPGNIMAINSELVKDYDLAEEDIKEVLQIETAEMNRRLEQYRGKADYLDLKGRVAFLVDDGIATGITVKAAVAFLRKLSPDKIIVASPVCSKEAKKELEQVADEVFCLSKPELFGAVGQFYKYFPQVTDEEVANLL